MVGHKMVTTNTNGNVLRKCLVLSPQPQLKIVLTCPEKYPVASPLQKLKHVVSRQTYTLVSH